MEPVMWFSILANLAALMLNLYGVWKNVQRSKRLTERGTRIESRLAGYATQTNPGPGDNYP